MQEIINRISEHLDDCLAIYGGVVAVCTVIVKLTPNTKDNEVLDKIISFIDLFSTAFKKADKEKLEK